MPTSSILLTERLSSIRACAAAMQALRIINDVSEDASSKRFVSSRDTRKDRWSQVMEIAQSELNGLGALSKAPVKRAKKKELPAIAPAPVMQDVT